MNFVAIDFETATSHRHSPCELGLTVVTDGRLAETHAWLIKPPQYPYFNPFNVGIHGIRPADVAEAPTFADLWPALQPWLAGTHVVVAHNAAFDLSVLRRTLEAYGLPLPALRYLCSVALARTVWTGLPAYDLKTLCRTHAIDLLTHHRAAADAKACAKLTLRAIRATGSHSVEEIATRGYARMRTLGDRG